MWAGFWVVHVFAQPFNQLHVRSYKINLLPFLLLSFNDRKFGTDVKPNQIRRNFISQNSALSLLTSPTFFFSQIYFSNV